jgi:hypothetical protein
MVTNYRSVVWMWNAFYAALESSVLGDNYAKVICYDTAPFAFARRTVIVSNANVLWLCFLWFLKYVLHLHVCAYLRHRYLDCMRHHVEHNQAHYACALVYEYRTRTEQFLCRRPVMQPYMHSPAPNPDSEPTMILSACVGGRACVTDKMQALVDCTRSYEGAFTAAELAVVLTGGTARFPRNVQVVWESNGSFMEHDFSASDIVVLGAPHVSHNHKVVV